MTTPEGWPPACYQTHPMGSAPGRGMTEHGPYVIELVSLSQAPS
jgi:hypothetical protein